MPDVETVKVSPTCGVPLMVGNPVAVELGRAATVAVAALVRDSVWLASSVKLTLTLIVLPSSAATSV